MTKPNIWFIMADQLRFDALGCYGNEAIETVNLDYFASLGTVFENGYSCSPTCVPARASLLTGQDVWNTGAMYPDAAQGPYPRLQTTLPQALAQDGYHTHCVGTLVPGPWRSLHGFHDVARDALNPDSDSDYMHWFNQNRPADCRPNAHGLGPNSWMSRPWQLPEYLHPTAWTAQQSIRFLQRRDPAKPFFLKTSFLRPHAPYDPPQYYFDLYDKKGVPAPVSGDWAGIHDIPTSDPDAWHGRRKSEEERRAKVGYYGSINFIDHQIGVVRQYLKKRNLLDNTIIVITSDHGDMMGDHHLWRKGYAYEGSAHIPFIVSLPKSWNQEVPSRVAAPVCLQDIMPTLLDACDVEIPATVDGKSVLPLLRGENAAWREFVHGEHREFQSPDNEMQYLTDGEWKYIWFPRADKEQLFHLKSDRYEINELAALPQYQDELHKWRGRLIAELQPRHAGLVKNGRLVNQSGKPPLVSPHYRGRFI